MKQYKDNTPCPICGSYVHALIGRYACSKCKFSIDIDKVQHDINPNPVTIVLDKETS